MVGWACLLVLPLVVHTVLPLAAHTVLPLAAHTVLPLAVHTVLSLFIFTSICARKRAWLQVKSSDLWGLGMLPQPHPLSILRFPVGAALPSIFGICKVSVPYTEGHWRMEVVGS